MYSGLSKMHEAAIAQVNPHPSRIFHLLRATPDSTGDPLDVEVPDRPEGILKVGTRL
jgi:hypothetical protein